MSRVAGTRIPEFWAERRAADPWLPREVPEAWAFGATAEHADSLLALVLAGTKTGTASSVQDYEASGDPLPREGEYSIILDGADRPRAVIRTTTIAVVPFCEVDAAHAQSEGEGDLSLAYWRTSHERYWRAHSEHAAGFRPDMPILCERFELIWPGEAGVYPSADPV